MKSGKFDNNKKNKDIIKKTKNVNRSASPSKKNLLNIIVLGLIYIKKLLEINKTFEFKK